MSAIRGRLFCVLALASFIGACTIMNGLEYHAQGDVTEPEDDGGTKKPPKDKDAQSATQADGAPVCTPKHLPDKPAAQPVGTNTEIVAALRSIDSTTDDDRPPNGIDLDGVCTCSGGAAESCKAATGAQQHCDYNNAGVDNAGRDIFKAIVQYKFNLLSTLEQNVQAGMDGRVVHVESYNGTPNDDDVKVSIHRSPGIAAGPDFTKVQAWKVDSQPAVSTSAWVTNNVLVANFDVMNVLFLDNSPRPAKLIGGRFTAQVIAGAGGPTIDNGLIVGRAAANEMIASVGELIPPELGIPLCQTGAPFRGFATGTVCTASDLALDPAKDRTGATCAALSLAVSFQLAPATLGSSVNMPRPGSGCDDQEPIVCP